MASNAPPPPQGPPYAALQPPPPQWPTYAAPPAGSWPAAPPPPPKTNRTVLIVVVAVVVVVLLLIVVGAALLHTAASPNPGGSAPTGPPPTMSQTLISSGQVWQIPASHYEYVGPFTLSSSAAITGVFTATGSGANAFILTPTEQQTFGSGSSSSPSSYVWTSGQVSTGSANTNLAAGTYYIDFVNQDSFSTTSVQVTSAFVATTSS